MALRVNKENFEEEALKEKRHVIVEFYSDSCIPCKQLSAILGELEDEHKAQLKFVKVNVNFSPELTEQYHIMASPTLLFFREGKEIRRIIGLTKKAVLNEIIENL